MTEPTDLSAVAARMLTERAAAVSRAASGRIVLVMPREDEAELARAYLEAVAALRQLCEDEPPCEPCTEDDDCNVCTAHGDHLTGGPCPWALARAVLATAGPMLKDGRVEG